MGLDQVQEIRREIYDYFHASEACQKHFFDDSREELYSGYYTSMYLIQDTSESIDCHREKDFSGGPRQSYIEFWGVMQAIFILQDSISELYFSVSGVKYSSKHLSNWHELRNLRNSTAGHPSKKDRPTSKPTTRTFMGRSFGKYQAIKFEQWASPGNVTHPVVDLGGLIDNFGKEAAGVMSEILSIMKSNW